MSLSVDHSHPLHRKSVPVKEQAGHLRKIASAAFEERAAERKKLRAILRTEEEDVFGIASLVLAQEKARLWRRVRARAVGYPEMEKQAEGAVFAPDGSRLTEEVRKLRTELRNSLRDGTEWEEREAARLFLALTDFIDLSREEPR